MSTERQTDDSTSIAPDRFHIVAGDCRVETHGSADSTVRGQIITVVKPDNTILVHDIEGYKPVAWLTRAESVTVDSETGVITAADGDDWLTVTIERSILDRELPGSSSGTPMSTCPDCNGQLIDTGDTVSCLGCRTDYRIPSDGTVQDSQCECGLPTMQVDRGESFDVCVDRSCEPLAEVVAERFSGQWDCPTCADGTLRIIRRNNILAACDAYPDCETAFSIPIGRLDGYCGCGLPRFRHHDRVRCLDTGCEIGT